MLDEYFLLFLINCLYEYNEETFSDKHVDRINKIEGYFSSFLSLKRLRNLNRI